MVISSYCHRVNHMVKLGEMWFLSPSRYCVSKARFTGILNGSTSSLRLPNFSLLVAFAAMSTSVHIHASEGFDRSVTPAVPAAKKLIKSGWDSPSPEYTRDHIREMEAASPLDGIVLTLADHADRVFDVKSWNEEKSRGQLDILKDIKWDKFKDNFIMIHTDSNMDWTDDAHWQTILARTKYISDAVKASGSKGVLFDPETYGAVFEGFTNPWCYDTQAHVGKMSYAEYSKVVARRGAEFMKVLQAGHDDLVVLSYYLYNVAQDNNSADSAARTARYNKYHYNLLTPFIDGMLEAASPGVRFVNINEPAYYYTNAQEYLESYLDMRRMDRWMVPPGLREKARRQMEAGQTVDADGVLSLIPEYVSKPGTFMTPAERLRTWEHNIYYAMVASDEYVVFYSMYQSWTNNRNILGGVEKGIERAREMYNKPNSVAMAKIDISDAVTNASQRAKSIEGMTVDSKRATVSQLSKAPASWQGAAESPGFTDLGTFSQALIFSDQPVQASTQAWVAYDKTNLYVRVLCKESDPKKLRITTGVRDHALWQGDHVQLMLENPKVPGATFKFMVNPSNVQWDGMSVPERDMGAAVNLKWDSNASVTPDGWWAEFTIPWSELKMSAPSNGEELKANLSRRRLPELEEATYWSPFKHTGKQPFEELGKWSF